MFELAVCLNAISNNKKKRKIRKKLKEKKRNAYNGIEIIMYHVLKKSIN
jgi:hypothetical protein